MLPQLIVGIKMELQKLNKSMCEELFGGELDVTEKPGEDIPEKSQSRQYRDWLHQLNEKDLCSLKKKMDTLKKMEKFCKTKKNMFLPIQARLYGSPAGDAGPQRKNEETRSLHRALRVPS